jgi:hypothetical protein
MELPIAVMITLFVAVVVAGAVIYFAQHSLQESSRQLNELNAAKAATIDQRIVALAAVTKGNVRALAEQCAADRESAITRNACYVLKSTSFAADIPTLNAGLVSAHGVNFTIVVAPGFDPTRMNALFIYFNPLGTIDVES